MLQKCNDTMADDLARISAYKEAAQAAVLAHAILQEELNQARVHIATQVIWHNMKYSVYAIREELSMHSLNYIHMQDGAIEDAREKAATSQTEFGERWAKAAETATHISKLLKVSHHLPGFILSSVV